MKRLVRNVIIFILVILSCNNVMAEEYEGTYTGEHGAQGKVMITIDFDENTVLGSTNGTIYDDKDEVKGKLTGTYDANSREIRGIITGKIIDPSGNENTTRNLSGTFTGNLSENKISGSWSCGDGFYKGTYRAQLRSASSLGLIVIEGMAYINNKVGNLAESYIYGNKDKLSLKTEEKSAVLSIIPGFAIFFGENTSAKISQEEITKDGKKQQVTKINEFSGSAVMVELQEKIKIDRGEEFKKKLAKMSQKDRDKILNGTADVIATLDSEIYKPKSRTAVDFNMKKFELITMGGGSYKPSYYDLACSGLPYGLLASNNEVEPGKCYVFAENGLTKIYVIKGNWAVYDEDGKNTVIMKPGEMTFYLQNSPLAKPQAFKPGEPEKIFETQTKEDTLVVDPPVTFDVEQGFNAPNITSVQNGQKVTFPIEIKGHTKPYATVELTYEYQTNLFNVLPVKGVAGTKRISADEKGYFYDKYTSIFGSGTQHTITATAIDSSGNKSPQTIIIITEQSVNNTNSAGITENDFDAWNNKGKDLMKLGKYEEAIKCFDKAIEIDPDYIKAWYNKGLALCNLKKYEEAIKCYDKAIEIDPEKSRVWYNKGLALYNLKKYEEAIKCYDKALEIDPENPVIEKNRKAALKALGR